MCSFRVDARLKETLEAAAAREGRSLSALIVTILNQRLDEYQAGSAARVTKVEKREHPRKEVLLPARWRIFDGDQVGEHDVIVRNISAGGAYTEYRNGHGFDFLQNMHDSRFSLVVRMPQSPEPVALDCEAKRIEITGDCLGVGLRFSTTIEGGSFRSY
jgi:hypothetical protein